MQQKSFPVIDPEATGKNIVRLRKERGMTVRDLQMWFGFEEPRAIYKWQQGQTLPTIDNLYALSALLDVPMEDILVGRSQVNSLIGFGRQDDSCRPVFFRLLETQRHSRYASAIWELPSGEPSGRSRGTPHRGLGIIRSLNFHDLSVHQTGRNAVGEDDQRIANQDSRISSNDRCGKH